MWCYGNAMGNPEEKLVAVLSELLHATFYDLSAWAKRHCVKCLVSSALVIL